MIEIGGIMDKNNNKKVISSLLIASMLTFGIGFSNTTYFQNTATAAQNSTLKGSIVTVPSGTVIPATAMMQLSSETLTLGQSVSLAVSNDFYCNNSLVAPVGSTINGTVIQVKKAGRAGVNGQLMIKFTNIVTPYGQMIPISAKIQTDDKTGLLKGATTADSVKEYSKDIAIGTAAGAVAGVIMGPLAGGKAGKGAAYGTAVGATAGLAKSIWDKGIPAEIPVGSVVNVVLDQQATFTQQQSYQY